MIDWRQQPPDSRARVDLVVVDELAGCTMCDELGECSSHIHGRRCQGVRRHRVLEQSKVRFVDERDTPPSPVSELNDPAHKSARPRHGPVMGQPPESSGTGCRTSGHGLIATAALTRIAIRDRITTRQRIKRHGLARQRDLQRRPAAGDVQAPRRPSEPGQLTCRFELLVLRW